jgi:thiol-disulfide isomerase/thioredoxin
MDILLLILRLVLTGVFGIAGIAKAFDPQGSMKAFADFGVPVVLRRPLVYLLPAFEIAVAVSLLFAKISWYGAIGAAFLLLVFVAGMLYQLAKGNAPDCHCFGQIHSEPVGVSSIVRNVVLLIPAGILAVQGEQGQGYSISTTPQEILTLNIGIVLASLALVAILYLKTLTEQQRRLMRQLEVMELVDRHDETVEREDIGHPREGLPFGALVPDFDAKDIFGRKVSLADIKAEGLPVLFLFVSPTCNPCNALRPDFDEWEMEWSGKMKLVFVSELDAKSNQTKFASIPDRIVLLQDEKEREISNVFRAKWTPMAVLMDRKGRIASFTAAGDIGIRELVAKIRGGGLEDYSYFTGRDTQTLTKIRIGESMRPVAVRDIHGNEFNSDKLRGKQALIAFWSPTCKYCVSMMDEIKVWDASKNGVDPELVIFADGDAEEHKKLGLNSPMIHDPGHNIGNTIGQYGTPSAIMIDEEGKFITETAVGAEDIWALVGKTPRIDG